MIATSKTSAAGALYSFGTTAGGDASKQDDEDDDESYDPETRQQELAQSCLDTMALNVPPKAFVPPALEMCAQV